MILILSVSIIPEEEIWKEVWKKYNLDPLGLRMYAGLSSTGHPELLITSPKDNWMIKRESPYSGKLGIGGRLEEYFKPKLQIDQAGFRPIPRYAIKKMIAMAGEGFDIIEATKIIESILAQEPTTFEELRRIRPPGVMQGPILHTYRSLQSIIGRQLEVDTKLEMELEKWKRRLGMYG